MNRPRSVGHLPLVQRRNFSSKPRFDVAFSSTNMSNSVSLRRKQRRIEDHCQPNLPSCVSERTSSANGARKVTSPRAAHAGLCRPRPPDPPRPPGRPSLPPRCAPRVTVHTSTALLPSPRILPPAWRDGALGGPQTAARGLNAGCLPPPPALPRPPRGTRSPDRPGPWAPPGPPPVPARPHPQPPGPASPGRRVPWHPPPTSPATALRDTLAPRPDLPPASGLSSKPFSRMQWTVS